MLKRIVALSMVVVCAHFSIALAQQDLPPEIKQKLLEECTETLRREIINPESLKTFESAFTENNYVGGVNEYFVKSTAKLLNIPAETLSAKSWLIKMRIKATTDRGVELTRFANCGATTVRNSEGKIVYAVASFSMFDP